VKRVTSAVFWQTTFALTIIVNLAVLVWSISRWIELKVIMWRSIWIIPLGLYLATLAGCVWFFLWIRRGNAERLLAFLELERFTGSAWRSLALLIFMSILPLIPALKFTFRIGEVVKKSTQDPVLTTIVFYWVVWWLVLLAAGALKVTLKTGWAGGFAGALLILGVCYEIFVRFHKVTTYPFSMDWSESSRFYYGSLYFAQSIYGMKVPLSTLHPSRYLLQALPFLFPSLGLTASRFWQFALWIGLTGATAVFLAWRVFSKKTGSQDNSVGQIENQPILRWLFAAWCFLFLLRVGVYYHLEVMVFVPIIFVSGKHPWRSLAAVIFASAWAGISRVNWFPMPAMIAIAIYLVEEPVSNYKKLWRYLAQPALWGVVGLGTALAAQAAYIPLSGNGDNAWAFASSFFSQLLWYRLWPNDSYALGIVPAILIVSGPLLVVLALSTRDNFRKLHFLRWVGLWGMLAVLFAGGLVVSVKIGGGGDLHNVDAYAVLIGVAGAFFIGGKVVGEDGQKAQAALSWPVVAIALLIPLIFIVPQLSPIQKFNTVGNQKAFAQLKVLVEKAGQDGAVLFINERHLVTFHDVDVPLVPEYEAVSLMEMAMSNNQPYLQQFYNDLKNHRFAGIVTAKLNTVIKEEGSFAEENNVWNQRVSPFILCYYEPVTMVTAPEPLTYIEADQSRIEFYVPRTTPGVCP